MSKPTITVIVPVYKAMATLDRCVESVVTQDVAGGLACILVDDGSPDDSGKLCDTWAARDPRVTVIHQDDLGVSGARNSGLAAADSEYIVFLDSDDALRPGALQAPKPAPRAAWPDCGWTACWRCPGINSTARPMPNRYGLTDSILWAKIYSSYWIMSNFWAKSPRISPIRP